MIERASRSVPGHSPTYSLSEGLCASVHNFSPVRSVYRWRGEVYERVEGRAPLRIRIDLVDAIVERVKASHPYEVPGISVRPTTGGTRTTSNG